MKHPLCNDFECEKDAHICKIGLIDFFFHPHYTDSNNYTRGGTHDEFRKQFIQCQKKERIMDIMIWRHA